MFLTWMVKLVAWRHQTNLFNECASTISIILLLDNKWIVFMFAAWHGWLDVVLANVWGTYQNKPSYVGGCLHYFRVENGAGKVSVWYCCDHSYSHWFQLNHITVSHTVTRSHCKLQNWSWCVVRLTVKLNGDKYWEYVLCHVHDALLYPKWAKGGGGQTCFQGFWSLGTHWCRKPMKRALGNVVVQAFWEWLCIWIQTWLAVSRRLLIWDLPLWALQCCCVSMLHREGDILTRHSMLHLYIWMVDVSWLCHWWDRPVLASSQWCDWNFISSGVCRAVPPGAPEVRMHCCWQVALLVGNHVDCFVKPWSRARILIAFIAS